MQYKIPHLDISGTVDPHLSYDMGKYFLLYLPFWIQNKHTVILNVAIMDFIQKFMKGTITAVLNVSSHLMNYYIIHTTYIFA